MSKTERFELSGKLEGICFKNERICALIGCIQLLLASGTVEICGAPDNSLEYALYEIELNLGENCEALRALGDSLSKAPLKQEGEKA